MSLEVRSDGRRVLPLVGRLVISVCRTAYQSVQLELRDRPEAVTVICAFELTRSDGSTVAGDPAEPADAACLLELAGRTIVESTFDAELLLGFDDGSALRVPSDPNYEAWQVLGPDGIRVVALPGGGEPAIWT